MAGPETASNSTSLVSQQMDTLPTWAHALWLLSDPKGYAGSLVAQQLGQGALRQTTSDLVGSPVGKMVEFADDPGQDENSPGGAAPARPGFRAEMGNTFDHFSGGFLGPNPSSDALRQAQVLVRQGIAPQYIAEYMKRTLPELDKGMYLDENKRVRNAVGYGEALNQNEGAKAAANRGENWAMGPNGPIVDNVAGSVDALRERKSAEGWASPPEKAKNAAAAYGMGTPEYYAALQGNMEKENFIPPIESRPGNSVIFPDRKTGGIDHIWSSPSVDGRQINYERGINNPELRLAPNALNVAAAEKYNDEQVRGNFMNLTGVDDRGNPVYSSRNQALKIPSQNPYADRAVNGSNFPGYSAPSGQAQSGLGQATPAYQTDPNAPNIRPGLAAGEEEVAKNGAKYKMAVDQAAQDAPQRIDVLKKIDNLSRTTSTGRGVPFQQDIAAHLPNLPIVGDAFNKAQDGATRWAELRKYLEQNHARAFQSMGGTGTDTQYEGIGHSQPNEEMPPEALRATARYIQAGVLADQAKRVALSQYQAGGGTPLHYTGEFETNFQKSTDPKIFQLHVASQIENPDERSREYATIMRGMSNDQRAALKQKYSQALSKGWLN